MSYLEMCKSDLNEYLKSALVTDGRAKTLYEAMNYSLLNDGKRLRPALCMATAETFGVSREAVLPAAAALEMIHSYSLIHDDLPCMDDDDLRRGQPTNHKVFGEAMALLAGDGLLTEAFVQLSRPLSGVSPERQVSMLHTLALRAGASGMVGGQAVDVELTGQDGTLDDVAFIHLHKTARLIQASIEIGALFPELPDEHVRALSVYGESLGLAFQMIDDVLDVVGSQDELGKTPGKDVAAAKLTYPRFIGVEETRKLAAQVIERGEQALLRVGIVSSILQELQSVVLERTH
ncbi:polyprenyl synthetase family protein [Alicyclobacillus acidoterrestris]|uniref:Farnesyl diphosphate synthase n=1 Tax=Alicyclobacillus acidoterrestris (strain ATCC 49025 / DSM 3922 / CIP 106132 / NCIMB 13137 / GD3B) TaxID=1356854 RepID=A0A9E6ZE10_ALIAG|nr:farnesyl diphosphate synthase [Alicyclobacillus acidoterrestris]UNO47475.1 polyprenyl synthetase family protein [Alicyclobacillus acidoterrestris]